MDDNDEYEFYNVVLPNLVKAAPVLLILTTSASAGPTFANEDITNAEDLIRQQYAASPGLDLQDVKLIRETPLHLIGFAHVKAPGRTYTVECDATMGDDGHYIAKCR